MIHPSQPYWMKFRRTNFLTARENFGTFFRRNFVWLSYSGVLVFQGYLSPEVNVVQGECHLGWLSPGVIVTRGYWSGVIVAGVIALEWMSPNRFGVLCLLVSHWYLKSAIFRFFHFHVTQINISGKWKVECFSFERNFTHSLGFFSVERVFKSVNFEVALRCGFCRPLLQVKER